MGREHGKKSRVYLLCGPVGSGKSTLAKKFERQGMTVLSYDAESFNHGITSHPLTDDILHEIKTDLDKIFLSLLSDKKDVVLDYSFWSKDMRARYILCLKTFGIEPTIYYVKTPKHICMERIRNRKGNHAKISS